MRTAQFEKLVAVSDVLVMTACQRAYSRSISRRSKYVAMRERHRAYEQCPIPEDKIEDALADAWVLCIPLVSAHDLDVDTREWVATLDGYTRSILLMAMPHAVDRLRVVLDALVSASVTAEEYRLDVHAQAG